MPTVVFNDLRRRRHAGRADSHDLARLSNLQHAHRGPHHRLRDRLRGDASAPTAATFDGTTADLHLHLRDPGRRDRHLGLLDRRRGATSTHRRRRPKASRSARALSTRSSTRPSRTGRRSRGAWSSTSPTATRCHDRLVLHGGQRFLTEECVMCHNPNASDVARRPAEAAASRVDRLQADDPPHPHRRGAHDRTSRSTGSAAARTTTTTSATPATAATARAATIDGTWNVPLTRRGPAADGARCATGTRRSSRHGRRVPRLSRLGGRRPPTPTSTRRPSARPARPATASTRSSRSTEVHAR